MLPIWPGPYDYFRERYYINPYQWAFKGHLFMIFNKVVALGYIKNMWAQCRAGLNWNKILKRIKEFAPKARCSLLVNGKVSRIISFVTF